MSSGIFVALFLWAAWDDPTKAQWRLGPFSAPPDFLLLMLWCWGDARREQIQALKVWGLQQVRQRSIGFTQRVMTRTRMD